MRSHIPVLLLAAGLATSSLAGPLNPPAGPVAPTMKTLVEVEPRTAINATNTPGNANAVYVISQSGSYYLTGNITGVPAKAAINITAGAATVDLNGFTISGGGDGIQVSSNGGYVIKNGQISGCSGTGVNFANFFAKGTVEDITVKSCTGDGFYLGVADIARRCTARGNGQTGFTGSNYTVLEDCTASQNTTTGFFFYGNCHADNCVAQNNGSDGFHCTGSSTLRGCRAVSNILNGFLVDETSMDNCTASYNGHCGFDIGSNSTMQSCVSQHNSTQGLHAVNRNEISACQFRYHAIGFTGLWLEGIANHVEDCESSSNGFGVLVSPTGSQNVVVNTRASGNSNANFSLPAGNQAAPIITNPAANSYATMTAWTNVVY